MDALTGGDAVQRAGRLADDLQRRGLLTDPRWREALRAVPRHLFIPQAGWAACDQAGGGGRRIDIAEDPAGWWDAVYSDSSIVIQADDGAGDPASGQGQATSSVSAPGVVIEFLELLGVRPHDRILEIGTGSGWTAALLCHVCGDRFVTSIEAVASGAAVSATPPDRLTTPGHRRAREGRPTRSLQTMQW